MKRMSRYAGITLALLMATSLVMAQTEAATKRADADTDKPKTTELNAEVAAYPLDYCIVTGEKLGSMGEPVVKIYDGREVRFCCGGCIKTFEKDRAKWEKKLDEAMIAAQKQEYPMETCVVSGEKLGGMGEPVNYLYHNRLIRFCCKGCIPTFEKDPGKYLGMLDAATQK